MGSEHTIREETPAQSRQGHHAFVPCPNTKIRLAATLSPSTSPPARFLARRLTDASQWFLVFTCVVMIILGVLGFSNLSHSLPLNDKLLHFFCFMLATGIFYFIFDAEE